MQEPYNLVAVRKPPKGSFACEYALLEHRSDSLGNTASVVIARLNRLGEFDPNSLGKRTPRNSPELQEFVEVVPHRLFDPLRERIIVRQTDNGNGFAVASTDKNDTKRIVLEVGGSFRLSEDVAPAQHPARPKQRSRKPTKAA